MFLSHLSSVLVAVAPGLVVTEAVVLPREDRRGLTWRRGLGAHGHIGLLSGLRGVKVGHGGTPTQVERWGLYKWMNKDWNTQHMNEWVLNTEHMNEWLVYWGDWPCAVAWEWVGTEVPGTADTERRCRSWGRATPGGPSCRAGDLWTWSTPLLLSLHTRSGEVVEDCTTHLTRNKSWRSRGKCWSLPQQN